MTNHKLPNTSELNSLTFTVGGKELKFCELWPDNAFDGKTLDDLLRSLFVRSNSGGVERNGGHLIIDDARNIIQLPKDRDIQANKETYFRYIGNKFFPGAPWAVKTIMDCIGKIELSELAKIQQNLGSYNSFALTPRQALGIIAIAAMMKQGLAGTEVIENFKADAMRFNLHQHKKHTHSSDQTP
jgi:hypothetical protein